MVYDALPCSSVGVDKIVVRRHFITGSSKSPGRPAPLSGYLLGSILGSAGPKHAKRIANR